MLVGGGELHETWTRSSGSSGRCRAASSASPASPRRWSTTRRRRRRCCRARRPARGPGARRAQRALRRARAAPGVRARRARLAEAAGALHRRAGAPLRAARRASAGSRRWPARSASRSTRCTARCPTPSRARASSARCSRSCAPTRPRSATRSTCSARAGARARPSRGEAIPRDQRPDLSKLPDDPGVYVFRDERGRPLYVGKSVSLRTRARAHFCAPAGWTERAEIVDYRPTNSELGALVLENRLIKQWQPAGNRALKRTDRYCYLRCRLDIPYPVLEVAPEPAAGPRREHRAAREPRARRGAGRPAHLAVPAAPLRAQAEAARAPVDLRADGPLHVALPGRPRPERLPPPARRGAGATSRSRARASGCSRRSTSGMREAAAGRSATSAPPALLRRRERLAWVLERLEGVLRATHAAPRLVLAQHPVKERFDAFWIVAGPAGRLGPAARAAASWPSAPRPRSPAPPGARRRSRPDEVDEVRIVAGWIAEHEPPTLAARPRSVS